MKLAIVESKNILLPRDKDVEGYSLRIKSIGISSPGHITITKVDTENNRHKFLRMSIKNNEEYTVSVPVTSETLEIISITVCYTVMEEAQEEIQLVVNISEIK